MLTMLLGLRTLSSMASTEKIITFVEGVIVYVHMTIYERMMQRRDCTISLIENVSN